MNPRGAIFRPRVVEGLMTELLKESLNDKSYDVTETPQMSVTLSKEIHDLIKGQGYERYKLVCHVILGQLKSQGLTSASRALWDEKLDNYACCHYQNDHMFCIATIHAVYYE